MLLRSFFSVFLIFFYQFQSVGQWQCGADNPTQAEKAFLQQLAAASPVSKARQSATNTTYRIGIKPFIVQTSSNPFNEASLQPLLQEANKHFSPLGIEFYWLPVSTIVNDNWADFKAEDEADFLASYQVKNGINVYFVKTYTSANGRQLNGSAALPNLAASSNRIFLSYYANSPDELKQLAEKIFPHELGHYFGLLHTFQDSNHPDLSKRELVERSLSRGANCHITADQLCDTPADPYERNPQQLIGLGCSDAFPLDLLDAKGQTYGISSGNLMSYQLNCGHYFTPQQYQKMQASFAVRFSHQADYQLLQTVQSQLVVSSFDRNAYCGGEVAKAQWKLSGGQTNAANLQLYLSDASGNNFQPIAANFSSENFQFVVPTITSGGAGFRIKVRDMISGVEGFSTDFLHIYPASIQFKASKTQIMEQESVQLMVEVEGKPPVQFQLSDGWSQTGVGQTFIRTVSPTATITYSFLSASTGCGMLTLPPAIQIDVVTPSLTIPTSSSLVACSGQQVALPVVGLLLPQNNVAYEVLLKSGNQETVLSTRQLGVANLVFDVPTSLPTSTTYNLIVRQVGRPIYSSPITLQVTPLPPKPQLSQSVFTYCYGQKPNNMVAANSTQLQWFAADGKAIQQPHTSKVGSTKYFVATYSAQGCVSEKESVEFYVKPQPQALIMGDTLITEGKEAYVKLKFLGELPWKVELSDGRLMQHTDSVARVAVKPRFTTAYTIRQASNLCGNAVATGEALVRVQQPLGVSDELGEEIKLYPNPLQPESMLLLPASLLHKKITLFLANGKGQKVAQLTTLLQNPTLNWPFSPLAAGTYFLQLTAEGFERQLKVVVL